MSQKATAHSNSCPVQTLTFSLAPRAAEAKLPSAPRTTAENAPQQMPFSALQPHCSKNDRALEVYFQFISSVGNTPASSLGLDTAEQTMIKYRETRRTKDEREKV